MVQVFLLTTNYDCVQQTYQKEQVQLTKVVEYFFIWKKKVSSSLEYVA